MSDAVKLHESWKAPLLPEFSSPYMAELRQFLVEEKANGRRIFPKGSEYFRALDLTPVSYTHLDVYKRQGSAIPIVASAASCWT